MTFVDIVNNLAKLIFFAKTLPYYMGNGVQNSDALCLITTALCGY